MGKGFGVAHQKVSINVGLSGKIHVSLHARALCGAIADAHAQGFTEITIYPTSPDLKTVWLNARDSSTLFVLRNVLSSLMVCCRHPLRRSSRTNSHFSRLFPPPARPSSPEPRRRHPQLLRTEACRLVRHERGRGRRTRNRPPAWLHRQDRSRRRSHRGEEGEGQGRVGADHDRHRVRGVASRSRNRRGRSRRGKSFREFPSPVAIDRAHATLSASLTSSPSLPTSPLEPGCPAPTRCGIAALGISKSSSPGYSTRPLPPPLPKQYSTRMATPNRTVSEKNGPSLSFRRES